MMERHKSLSQFRWDKYVKNVQRSRIKYFWSTAGLLVIFFIFIVHNSFGQELSVKELHSDWKFKQVKDEDWHPATIPGTVHTDLFESKLIEMPFYRDNEHDLQWIGKTDWEYRTSFDLSKYDLSNEKMELVFEGLDTYADVYLNDSNILFSDNMFRTWKIDVKDFLKEGKNTLHIIFKSPTKTVEPIYDSLSYQYPSNIDPAPKQLSVFVRKAPYHFGWDWGPRFVTCGIWRPVKLIAWNQFKVRDLHITQQSLTQERAKATAILEIEATKPMISTLRLNCSKEDKLIKTTSKKIILKAGRNIIKLPFEVENPEWWWPNGLGEPHLYDVVVELSNKNRTESVSETIGFRTIRVITEKDSIGESFTIEVNGFPVFMKGANYIPHNFLNRVSKEQYQQLIADVKAANMNMIRVWGGGIYEEDLFYDLCDQNGILVWQDFMFACAMYPGYEAFLETIKEEAIDNVKRLRNHPSLALWCGDNEDEMFWNSSWSRWRKKGPPSIWEDYLKLKEVLSSMVNEYDSGRFYHWSSPSSLSYDQEPNDPRYGDMHYWGVWHAEEPFSNFLKLENTPRFMSEYGMQSFPMVESIEKFTIPSDHRIDSDVMLAHQKNEGGNARIKNYMDRYFGEPRDFSSFLYLSQVQQAEAMKIAADHHRRSRPRTMGTLYWQLNDCWPAASWSGIDYYGKWKALHHYAKDFFAPIRTSFVETEDSIQVYVVNDHLKSLSLDLSVDLLDFKGEVLNSMKIEISVKANSSQLVSAFSKEKFLGGNPKDRIYLKSSTCLAGELIDQNRHFFVKWKDLQLPDYKLKYEVEHQGEKVQITLTTDAFVKSLYLNFPGVQGSFRDNFFDLDAGFKKLVVFIPGEEFNREDLHWTSVTDALTNQK